MKQKQREGTGAFTKAAILEASRCHGRDGINSAIPSMPGSATAFKEQAAMAVTWERQVVNGPITWPVTVTWTLSTKTTRGEKNS